MRVPFSQRKTRLLFLALAACFISALPFKAGADLLSGDIEYLTQLGLMRGHLLVGYELYRVGMAEHARTHMKHPENELYADLVPALTARGAPGFADQLETLARAVETGGSQREVASAYDAVVAAIRASESAVPEANRIAFEPGLERIVRLLRIAAEEYAIGVVDGRLDNAHEYQDAYGFTRVAIQIANDIDVGGDEARAAALGQTKKQIEELAVAWPALMPTEPLNTDASELYDAATRIEMLTGP